MNERKRLLTIWSSLFSQGNFVSGPETDDSIHNHSLYVKKGRSRWMERTFQMEDKDFHMEPLE